jgi:hypothetical protein
MWGREAKTNTTGRKFFADAVVGVFCPTPGTVPFPSPSEPEIWSTQEANKMAYDSTLYVSAGRTV